MFVIRQERIKDLEAAVPTDDARQRECHSKS
jgi:hypothetical protein